MNLLIWHAIPTDVLIDRFAMFLIITQGIEDLGECEVRQPPDDFFRRDAEFPQLSDCAYRGAGPRDDGSPVENVFGADNVGMTCCGRHAVHLRVHYAIQPTGGRRRSQFPPTGTYPLVVTVSRPPVR